MLDSGPLGLLSNPGPAAEPRDIREWALHTLDEGATIVGPRSPTMKCAASSSGWQAERDQAAGRARHGFTYDPLRTSHFRRAAALWAEARNRGVPTAHDAALDGDVILAAQALGLMTGDPETVVVTTNPKHLTIFVPALRWRDL